jgi:hypothetical protein
MEEHDTRLWMGGIEVEFIKWTPHGLVYTRVGSTETLANLSRNTVIRLLQEGTLRIEGYRPAWAELDDREAKDDQR